MSFLVWVLIGGIGFVGLLISSFIFVDRKTYKFPAMVFIPTGDDPSDGIWQNDRFKIKKHGKGHSQVRFFKNRGKCYSPQYRFWSKWLNPKRVLPSDDETWAKVNDPDFRKHLLRGAHFYKVSDLEYKVMKVNTDGNFEVLDDDSREMAIDDIERDRALASSFRDKLLQAGVWIGSLFVIALLMIALFVLTTNYAGEQAAQIISLAKQVVNAQASIGG